MPVEETLSTIMHMTPVALLLAGLVYAVWDVSQMNQKKGEQDGLD